MLAPSNIFCGVDGPSARRQGRLMTLSNLTPGMTARITGYESGNRAYRAKLLALGLTRGTTIRMVNAEPLGDPVQLEVRGFNVSLRKSEAAVVKVAAV